MRARSGYPSGSLTETCTGLPFGDGQVCTGADVSPRHFTGKERHAESGLDNFGARYHASSMGRFMSPDPMGGDTKDPESTYK
jgi:RHS repeat-associated protein